jgi:hypothetical protein
MDRIARLDARRDDDEVDSSCSLRWFLRRFIPLINPLSLAPAYCASLTLSAKATVYWIRARASPIVCSLSSCLGGTCPESQAAAPLT